jgi:hypothetical protein
MRAPRIRRTKRDQELEEEPRQASPQPAPPTPQDLPKAVGNRAFGAAIQRWSVPVAPRGEWPKEPQVLFDGKTIPLVSFSWGGQNPTGSGGGPGKAHVTDVEITTRAGDHSAELGVAADRSQHFKTLVIVMPKGDGGTTITFKDVMISTFSGRGDVETWKAIFDSYEIGTSPPPS